MNNARLMLELYASRYREAVENDDFDTQNAILLLAVTTPNLEERILLVHSDLEEEQNEEHSSIS